jgi:adenylate cyclase
VSEQGSSGPAGPSAGDPATRALQPFLGLDHVRYGLDDVARLSGLDPDQLRDYWRALGFPDPRPGEELFTESDVEMLVTVVGLIAEGSVEPEVAKQMARVIGSSLDRIAAAQIDAYLRRASAEPDADRTAMQTAVLIPRVLELVWRRRLAAEAQRRLVRAGAEGAGPPVCVGFADLVGFTAQTQQLDTSALAEVVGRFEAVAYDEIEQQGGRVVKTIGDEVMFVHDDVDAGCRTALALARRYREDDALSDVRVGLAVGPVLERDGDVYGHTVNLASRIVSVAYPGSVVVSTEVRDAVKHDPDLTFTSLRSHYLKDIGRVPLWRMRLANDPFEWSVRGAREERSARRRVLDGRWERQRRDARQRAEGVVPGLRFDLSTLPGRLPEVLAGTAAPEVIDSLVEDPTAGELEALAAAVLDSDIDPDLQVDLLTDLGAAESLRELQLEAERMASEADLEAEAELRRIEQETAEALELVEREHRERVAAVIARATEASKAVDERAARRLRQVAEEADRKADQATRDARARARRAARQRARLRGR